MWLLTKSCPFLTTHSRRRFHFGRCYVFVYVPSSLLRLINSRIYTLTLSCGLRFDLCPRCFALACFAISSSHLALCISSRCRSRRPVSECLQHEMGYRRVLGHFVPRGALQPMITARGGPISLSLHDSIPLANPGSTALTRQLDLHSLQQAQECAASEA